MSKFISPATPRPRSLRFPRSARIRLSRDFAFVRKEGRVAQGRLLRLSAVRLDSEAGSRFGFITSRKVGGAVVRNRVRRRLREIARLERHMVPAGWLVVSVAKSTAAGASFPALREEWLLLLQRLSILPGSR